MGFCCVPSRAKLLPKKSPSSSPSSSSFVNDSDDDSKKKQQEKQGKQEQQQGVKDGEEGKKEKKGNLDRAVLTTPYFPFHSRPGLQVRRAELKSLDLVIASTTGKTIFSSC